MNLKFTLGDTEEIELIITDYADVVQNITGFSFWFTMKKDNTVGDGAAILQKTLGNGIEITSAEDGKVLITIEPEDREFMKASSTYKYDVQVKDTSNRITTILRGEIEVLPDTTHATS